MALILGILNPLELGGSLLPVLTLRNFVVTRHWVYKFREIF